MNDLNLAQLNGRCASGYAPIQHPRYCNCAQVPTIKRTAIAAVNDAAPADVKNRVDRAIIRLASAGREFSANDLRTELEGVPGPVVGGRFNALAKQGVIVQTGGRVPSNLGSTHGHELKCWRGAAA